MHVLTNLGEHASHSPGFQLSQLILWRGVGSSGGGGGGLCDQILRSLDHDSTNNGFEKKKSMRTQTTCRELWCRVFADLSRVGCHGPATSRQKPVIQCGTRVLVPLWDSLMFGRVLK